MNGFCVKTIFIDLETTGLTTESGVIQIAGIVRIDRTEKERFDFRCRPFDGEKITKEAMEITKMTPEKIWELPDPREIYSQFISILDKYVSKFDKKDKFTFFGYNSRFDAMHLRAWFEKNDNNFYGSYFHWPEIDISNLAALHFMKQRSNFVNFKLGTVLKAAGIEVDESRLHDGLYDIENTMKLMAYIIKESNLTI